ncbi:hypothetical protein [Pseudovibrio sp. Alg231-02]|uniref:hypothetical protein n=1 Tax=Pseudovibrio sp. Alg231-02 TaxID=1922223 RepID=UPI00131EE75E|nr:hypothetical protein [Pseudovibrio sp. Alg231-02]
MELLSIAIGTLALFSGALWYFERKKRRDLSIVLVMAYWPAVLLSIEILFLGFATVYCEPVYSTKPSPACNILGIDATAHLTMGSQMSLMIIYTILYCLLSSFIWAIAVLVVFIRRRLSR